MDGAHKNSTNLTRRCSSLVLNFDHPSARGYYDPDGTKRKWLKLDRQPSITDGLALAEAEERETGGVRRRGEGGWLVEGGTLFSFCSTLSRSVVTEKKLITDDHI